MFRFLPLCTVALAVTYTVPAAADSQQIGAFQSWGAYVSHGAKGGDGGQDVCYISSKPVNTDSKNSKNRAGVFAEVTHRPGEHHLNVFDMLQSYTFKPGVPATLAIGGETFTLFTHGVAAFAHDDDDAKIIAAMRGGATTMVFTGSDKKGKQVKDSFSLAGMEQAYQAIGKACHVSTGAARKAGTKKK